MHRFFCILLLFISINCFSQEVDSLRNEDTSKVHSVKKATIFSAIIPGAGQIYNHTAMPKGKRKAYWKVPLIYAGLGATGYMFVQSQSTQRSLKQEYLYRKANNSQPLDTRWEAYDDQGVLMLFREQQNRRDMFLIATTLVYAFQVLDAAVEAHFVSFDVSEDLSLQIRPKMYQTNQVGLHFSLKFH
jgi:hypothetical protein